MTFLQRKMTNLIGKEIQTPFGACEVMKVTDKHVTLKDMGDTEFEVELWKFAL
ncbi:hypothetical protein [Bacillus sp. M6-12]|uniref:hypothetical protein n=1 Tax=Bacillus sp. M6-12 TaxID=2054166 RepID=UPI0015E14530|nr:hypothetical protein [Bacillus sp. M6-12]